MPDLYKTPQRELAEKVLRAEAAAVLSLVDRLDEAFDRAVTLLADCKGMVVVTGLGKSGLIGTKLSATLASTGSPSHFLHPAEAMHGDLGRIRREDVALMLSYGGETEEVVALAALLKQDGVPIVAITGKPDSHLARLADVLLNLGDITEACPHNLAPTATTTAILALGDALALSVSDKKGFTATDFRKSHPGGQLGRQMMPITQALRFRVGVNLPLVSEGVQVQAVLQQAAQTPRRAGAVLLVNENGKLSGIFTDADLRRLLLRDGVSVLNKPIREVMTRNPTALSDAAVVREAVQLMREKRLDEIPVVDDQGKPVGLIDVQDLIALKVIEE